VNAENTPRPPDTAALPTRRQLLRATAFAVVAAGLVTATIVAPAEYGVDPTGIGTRLGLRRSNISSAPVAPEAGATVAPDAEPFRTDQLQVTLAWGEDVEIKATMRKGQSLVFSWESSGGPVNVDMHGEPLSAENGEAMSYAKAEDQLRAHGTFRAPFDGKHGWYWENYNENPVTITVRTSGFYSKIARQ
jgi:hypothetical protein